MTPRAERLPRRRDTPRRSTAAFTLLEVLLAITVGSVVLAAITTVFFGALRLRERTSRLIENGLPVQRALQIVTRDLANLVPPGGSLAGAFSTTPTNTPLAGQVSPDLFTASGSRDVATPWPDLQKVAYLLLPSTNRQHGKQLVRAVTRNLLSLAFETPAYEPLLDGVESLTLRYHDGSQWQSAWDSSTAATPLPAAILIELQLEAGADLDAQDARQAGAPILRDLPPAITAVVPILINGSTNDAASSTTSSSSGSTSESSSGGTGGTGGTGGGTPPGGGGGTGGGGTAGGSGRPRS